MQVQVDSDIRGQAAAGLVDFAGGILPVDAPTAEALGQRLRHADQRLRRRIGRLDRSSDAPPVGLQLDEAPDLPAEAFRLDVGHRGVAIGACDERGHRYGLHALAKLIQSGKGLVAMQSFIDVPRVGVRGLMLDAGRRYWSMRSLHRVLDEMAWNGLNRLQLHLTEWNAFRIALDDPRFADLGAEQSYRPDELNALIERAHADGIDVSVELNLPGHCTALIAARPALNVGAEDAVLRDGSMWTGHATEAWMIDVADPLTRAFCADLVRAVVTEIRADSFHLGGDEWFDEAALAESPTLLRAAVNLTTRRRSALPCTPADVVVDFMNAMCAVVASCDGRAELWSGWDRAGAAQVHPNIAVTITAWAAEDESAVLQAAGYRVIASPEHTHYVTPRTAPGNLGDVNYVAVDYSRLATEPLHSSTGEQLCVWSDWAENEPDDYFAWYARRPLQIFADRVWNGPRETAAHVDEIALAADRTSDLDFDQVQPGREITLETGARLAAVRVNPVRGLDSGTDRVHSVAGKWSPETAAILEQWRGATVEVATTGGIWQVVHRLDRQLSPTWVTVPLDCPLAAASRVRWTTDPGRQPTDDQVEWLVTADRKEFA